MKRLILFLTVLFIGTIAAQEGKKYKPYKDFKKNKIEYLSKDFEERKQVYIGKTVNELIRDFEIPVYGFISIGGKGYVSGIYLNFLPEEDMDKERDDLIMKKEEGKLSCLAIIFEKTLKSDDYIAFLKTYGNKWTAEAIDFFGGQVIKDIGMVAKKKKEKQNK